MEQEDDEEKFKQQQSHLIYLYKLEELRVISSIKTKERKDKILNNYMRNIELKKKSIYEKE